MQFVTLINRTSKVLEGVWDGKHYKIVPGKNSFPLIQAEAFKRQNPVMGSEDPHTGQMDYLVAIEEQSDSASPIEQTPAIERWDREKVGGPKVEVIQGKGGLFSSERQSPITHNPDVNGFVTP